MCEVATGFRPAFLFSSGCPCANVERTPGATYMSATGKIGTLHRHPHAAPQALAPAALACMGVVFGDIGTSPLYTVSVTLKASSSGGTVAPEAARDRVTDLLVADRRHLHQIRGAHHAPTTTARAAFWRVAQYPCCINEFAVQGDCIRALRINDTAHLAALHTANNAHRKQCAMTYRRRG